MVVQKPYYISLNFAKAGERKSVFEELTKTHFFGSICIDERQQTFGESKSDSTCLADETTFRDGCFKVNLTQLVDKVQRKQHLLANTQSQYNVKRLLIPCK